VCNLPRNARGSGNEAEAILAHVIARKTDRNDAEAISSRTGAPCTHATYWWFSMKPRCYTENRFAGMCRMNELSRPTRYGDGDGRIEWTSLNWTIWSSESAKACATDTIVVWFRRVTCVMKQFFFAPRTVGYRNVIWQFKDACYSFRPKIVGAWLLPVLKRRKEANLECFLISGGQFGKKGQESVWKQGKISSSTLLYCQGWYFLTSKSSKSLCPFGHLRVSPLVAAVLLCPVGSASGSSDLLVSLGGFCADAPSSLPLVSGSKREMKREGWNSIFFYLER
jgi:hypothetical protein